MLNKKNRVLAIDPGSREMGLAVLDDSELIHYAVKTLKQFRPKPALKKAVKDILTRLIIEYAIKTLVFENGWFSQVKSPLFQAVVEAIKEIAKAKGLKTVSYAPKTIRKLICQDGKATKKRTAQILANRYPELAIYLQQDYRWKEKYWLNAFDAIAAGLTHIEKSKE
jgi:Holliday junction resolvasome RuvABC endonuclease subunit